ncbi:multidrug resistance-associated ABC transporter [Neolentinus lepideus HHB14362 ss-1]|uniref:Multidrug resistance-associated ABC transporter n=1 Tax=Neolentinus lepideus HHB14362 ss-1 TaxID=1314782 RepID=A0A165Q0R6_9AGAM|nr:multidrug resistance-associated ABC transporter [Neolentinus lepideus HHB14362 ss-1]
MGATFCHGSSPLDLQEACVRQFWSASTPATFVFLLCLGYVPLPSPLRRFLKFLKSPFSEYITLEEAEAFNASLDPEAAQDADKSVPLWRTVVLTFIALLESLVWLAVGAYRLFAGDDTNVWTTSQPILVSLSWFYASLVPILRPKATPSWDLLILYFIHFVIGIVSLGAVLYNHNVYLISLPHPVVFVATIADMVGIIVLLAVELQMPVAVPSKLVKKEEIGKSVSPEDYTPLWGWISFHWVWPLIKRGTHATLNEGDVWSLSPMMQSRPIFIKFSMLQGSLIWRIWKANSKDILLDFIGTYVSVVCNYLGPFFLKKILDAIQDGSKERIQQAYIYALLAFLSQVAKAEADVQHLWFGRRAASRTRSELMAAIYAKALKRRDFSGIIDSDKAKDAKDAKDAKEGKEKSKEEKKKDKAKEDDPKAGADTGKIVNLMAGDSNRVAMLISGMYFIYGAPFEILIASLFLYQLLGLSAFAGFVVLLLGWPLNSFIARRAIRIQKGLLAARDKRMGVLNELIGAVKFIKFFAWENRWIDRAMEARQKEIQWMVKARINSVMFSMLWTCAPILVSLISFFTYVMLGHELTVSIAFTSLSLFGMIRQPLNIIPAWIVQILQTRIAIKRIETFLDEDEVSDQVSSLKGSARTSSVDIEEGFGIVDGTFKWNEVEETAKGKDSGNGKKKDTKTNGSNSASEEASATDSTNEVNTTADHRFELKDVNVMFPEGKLSLITGPTASGKTALLMALLGEMTTLSGRIVMLKDPSRIDANGLMHSISYAAQSPWLRHQSIRDNILFGYPYDEKRYEDVIDACALRPDLDMLEDGDSTEIGARGVSLSGGQKARVALARAVYARTQYVLLDDPLSAVDSHTARLLFENLLKGPLLENRTVILVTHHVELVLPGANYLVRMLDGRIDTQGKVEELRERGLLDDIAHDSTAEQNSKEVEAQEEKTEEELAAEAEGEDAQKDAEAKTSGKKKPRKLVKDEHRETGSVKWSIYKTYLKASSYWTWAILVMLIVLMQVAGVTEKVWIKVWGEAYGEDASPATPYLHTSFAAAEHEIVMSTHLSMHHAQTAFLRLQSPSTYAFGLPRAQDHPLFYVGIYAAIGLISVTINLTSIITQITGALRASRLLFRQLLVAVVRATMRWHDVTPQGRMLNRFSKDIETVDSSLSSSLQAVNSSLANFFASVITVTVIFPLFLLPASILGLVYRFLAIGYLNTGRDLRRMESNSRSPIFAGFGELLEGIVTVRAFSAEQRFLDELHGKIDLTTKMWYSFWMTNRWLLLNFDILGTGAVLITTLFSLSGLVSAGTAGLCITSAMNFTTSIYWACRFWTALELDLNSVERVVEYLDLPQEPPAIIESNRPPAYWPSSSDQNALISVEDLVIKYAPELPPVLQGVSFELRSRERIGLLGRTGSGKSTLAMSILRFVDPTSGRIMIDGIDISTIGVHDLRSRITFIPQDAALFSGTLRDNLDPFNEHTDEECLDVLYRVRMMSESAYESQRGSREPSRPPSLRGVDREATVASSVVSATATEVESKTTISLETQVSAGGTNFSQGQRQLVALARALLRRSSIIVLDEATSSIDFATDAKIQETIREEFNDSLLLTVAHRLKTVIDYDRLIVLDKGQIAEFDTPFNLIQKEDGIFRHMCLRSGTFSELEAVAKAKAEGKIKSIS